MIFWILSILFGTTKGKVRETDFTKTSPRKGWLAMEKNHKSEKNSRVFPFSGKPGTFNLPLFFTFFLHMFFYFFFKSLSLFWYDTIYSWEDQIRKVSIKTFFIPKIFQSLHMSTLLKQLKTQTCPMLQTTFLITTLPTIHPATWWAFYISTSENYQWWHVMFKR